MLTVLLLLAQAAPERRWEQMEYGPFLTAAITLPGKEVVPKGVVIRTGSGAVCFDTDLLRMAGGWTGGWLDLRGPAFDGNRNVDDKTRPVPKGTVRFGARGPGWARQGDLKDPRAEPYGPLPADWAKWKGLYVHGDRVVLSYTVGACSVLELPELVEREGGWAFGRTFRIGPSTEPLALVVCDSAGGGVGAVNQEVFAAREGLLRNSIALLGDLAVGVCQPGGAGSVEVPETSGWEIRPDGKLLLKLPALPSSVLFRVMIGSGRPEDRAQFARFCRDSYEDPAAFTTGGPARYPQEVATRGALGKTGAAYEVDTLTVPEENPWKSWMRFGGLDFFPDGRAALCTWSGDVWIVSGIDETLGNLRWRRFATGLFQPCGLKILGPCFFVAARDAILRLHDLNGDGEADFYESYNNDVTEAGNYHEFMLDLQAEGASLYTVKGGLGANFPTHPPARHHGCLLRIPWGGEKVEVVATGIRAGAGMAIGPRGEITVSDNEGHWGPASRLNLVRPGGFYGDMKTHHRATAPATTDPPLCWIPKAVDNSSGGQVWVTHDRWGPFQGRLLHLSYGTASLFHVLIEEVDGVAQGGVVRFPLAFASGILRARFHPKDGQLYVAGLKGWSTAGARDGCFQRVRYTGKPFCTVRSANTRKEGIELRFTEALDRESAADVDRWAVLQWNYLYSEKYGSPDFSVANPKKQGRDPVEVKSVKLSEEGRCVVLEIPDLKPVMQMMIRYRLRSAAGAAVAEEAYLTLNRVPE
jgi:hypothetical protein